MKRRLLYLLALFPVGLILNAQTQTISFEASEGYNQGTIVGQNGWEIWNTNNPSLDLNFLKISTAKATDGVSSLALEGGSGSPVEISKDLSALIGSSDSEISFDFHYVFDFVSYPTDNFRFSISTNTPGASGLGGFVLTRVTKNINWIKPFTGGESTGPVLQPNVWHNIRFVLKNSENSLTCYIDGNLEYSAPFVLTGNANAVIGSVHKINFSYPPFPRGFYIDNMKITKLGGSLAVHETSKEQTFKISPNPAQEILNIESDAKISLVSIFDAKGSLIKNIFNPDKSLHISDLTTGVYIIKVKTEKSEFTQKFIKK
ncbi:T9SS type A sorting domain-containing protein [Chryseobacterium culicis]|uniref:Por secretion system C-terminal sorting domain-containing protein n=1 Tax=Chryseobacterium culicis TaxID=680127 RepID=A0A1H6IG20_CHRCI|nr:T9SS type A sorting domain-containing protein [Chryseobacterium culicis]SEH45260.1 Por secretion system C-terminal sorting domain-containing protein [Chryseobacterium culicis]